jgi:hypothetical protein
MADQKSLEHLEEIQKASIRLERPVPYVLDGGARRDTRRLQARSEPAAISVAAPRHGGGRR